VQTRLQQVKRNRDVMILLLALAGAGVDAVVILGFSVLTAAQTGNTILLAVAIARGDIGTGISATVSIAGFVVGAAVGEWVTARRPDSQPGGSGPDRALILELAVLTVLIVSWRLAEPVGGQSVGNAVVALAAVAMGIQSAAVLRLRAHPTTYVTGILTNFTTGVMQGMFPRTAPSPAQPVGHRPGSGDEPPGEGPWKNGLTWVVYAIGAIFGAILFLRVGEMALLVPLGALAAAIVLDPRHG
jgi:uncharacterized membrane protein YoaK (UPF0700 family)